MQKPGPDPRFGLQAPFPSSMTIRTPSGLTYTRTETRSVTLGNPPDPLRPTALTDTVVLNGKTFTRTFNASTRTITDRTPVGRTEVTTLDSQGRMSTVQRGGFALQTYGYDAQGRLHTITQGTGQTARTHTLNYDAENRLASLVDPLTHAYRPDGILAS